MKTIKIYYVETETTKRFGRAFKSYILAYIYAQLIGLLTFFGTPERVTIYHNQITWRW